MKSRIVDTSLRCSFCNERQEITRKLISSSIDRHRAYICDACVEVCNSILEDARLEQGDVPPAKPSALDEYLGQEVVASNAVRKKRAVVIADQIQSFSPTEADSKILLMGPANSKKTHFGQILARFLKVPFATVDAANPTLEWIHEITFLI